MAGTLGPLKHTTCPAELLDPGLRAGRVGLVLGRSQPSTVSSLLASLLKIGVGLRAALCWWLVSHHD